MSTYTILILGLKRGMVIAVVNPGFERTLLEAMKANGF